MASITWCTIFVVFCMLLAASGADASGNVTLQSLTIFNSHEWFGRNPEVYFRCHGESKIELQDVTLVNEVYRYQGQESWQVDFISLLKFLDRSGNTTDVSGEIVVEPLTTLVGSKCKRCGLFEKDIFRDDTFDEWELCPADFSLSPEGLYVRTEEGEFDMILWCPDCNQNLLGGPTRQPSVGTKDRHGLTAALILFILFSVGGLVLVACSQWRRKREEQQARFIKLFEDDDFLDEELGLKDDL